ncbi:hypothetical protein F110043I8_32820 [Ruminococcus sp. f11]|jgi:hypothetical protein
MPNIHFILLRTIMHAGHTIKITIKHTKKEYNTLSRIVETSTLIRIEKSLITIRRIGS